MRDPSYLNLLMTFSRNGRFPSPLLNFLLSSPTVDILNSNLMKPVFKWFYVGLRASYKTVKKLAGRPF
jgi:hypothetical protein